MEPFEPDHVPLAHVEQADDANKIQALNGAEADEKADQLVLERGWKGKDRSEQDDQCLDAVAARLDTDPEARSHVPDFLAPGHDTVVEHLDQEDTDLGYD